MSQPARRAVAQQVDLGDGVTLLLEELVASPHGATLRFAVAHPAGGAAALAAAARIRLGLRGAPGAWAPAVAASAARRSIVLGSVVVPAVPIGPFALEVRGPDGARIATVAVPGRAGAPPAGGAAAQHAEVCPGGLHLVGVDEEHRVSVEARQGADAVVAALAGGTCPCATLRAVLADPGDAVWVLAWLVADEDEIAARLGALARVPGAEAGASPAHLCRYGPPVRHALALHLARSIATRGDPTVAAREALVQLRGAGGGSAAAHVARVEAALLSHVSAFTARPRRAPIALANVDRVPLAVQVEVSAAVGDPAKLLLVHLTPAGPGRVELRYAVRSAVGPQRWLGALDEVGLALVGPAGPVAAIGDHVTSDVDELRGHRTFAVSLADVRGVEVGGEGLAVAGG